jgi:hypothetical protein
MFLGHKVMWLHQETFEEDQFYNWHYRECHHVRVFPGLRQNKRKRGLPRDLENVRVAVARLLLAQKYLQQTTALDWDRDFYNSRKPRPLWYCSGIGSNMLNHRGQQLAWSLLLRLPAVRAESLTRARNLEARATLARFFRGHVDVIHAVMQYLE